MTELDNKALNATETRNKRGYQIAIILLLLAMLTTAAYLFKVVKDTTVDKEQHLIDSFSDILKSKDKYIGIVESDLSQQKDRRVKAENALRDRKPIYVYRTDSIIANAPDTCKEYLIAVRNECDTLQAKSDSLINELKIEVAKSDTVIEAYKSKGETLEHFNDKLTSENKELGNENKQLVKSNKWQKRWANFGKGVVKVAIGAAVVWTGFVMWVTISK